MYVCMYAGHKLSRTGLILYGTQADMRWNPTAVVSILLHFS